MQRQSRFTQIHQYIASNQLTQATAAAMRLMNPMPASDAECSELGLLCNQLKHYALAFQLFNEAVRLAPNKGDHHYNLATVHRFMGRHGEAEQSLLQAVGLNPLDCEAWHLLANIKKQTLASNHVAQLRQLLAQARHPQQSVWLGYALAKELEDLGDFDASFVALSQAADTRRQHMQYQVETDLDIMQSVASHYPAKEFEQPLSGHQDPAPIFILGMPRTGSTLVEQILATHCQVHSCGEINNFALSMMEQLREQGLVAQDRESLIAQSTKLDFAELGERYLNSLKPLRGTEPFVIDKLPFNFLYAGLIHKALPKAKIIHLQRDPMDTCYAVYKQLFERAYPYSYKLSELSQYYQGYRRLMTHWEQVLPGQIYHLSYETLVCDTEQQVRQLLDFCDLPFQPECLTFYNNQQASTTASASQVRQPVYASSIGKWRHVQRHLISIQQDLQQAGMDSF